MCKIAFDQFIDNKKPDFQIVIFRKVKEPVTEEYLGTTPVTEINGHDLTIIPNRTPKSRGEDIFNKIHELFDPLMKIQNIVSKIQDEGLRTAIQDKFILLSQNVQKFGIARGDKPPNANMFPLPESYVRIPTDRMIDIGTKAVQERKDTVNSIEVYQHDYNIPRYAIIKSTLDRAWDQFRSCMRLYNYDEAKQQLLIYKIIIENCLLSDEDILLNCVDVHAFYALCITRKKEGGYNNMISATKEMIQTIHDMADAAWNIADILTVVLFPAPNQAATPK